MKKVLISSLVLGLICSACSFSTDPSNQESLDSWMIPETVNWNLQSWEEKTDEYPEFYLASWAYTKLLWTGYEDIRQEALNKFRMFEGQDMYTNDPSWKISMLPLSITWKDEKSYKPYFLPEPHPAVVPANLLDWHGEDKEHLFLDFGLVATKKSELPDYIPLQFVGTQAILGLVGYSDGYLVVSPFKFPVDKATFKAIQDKVQFHERKDDRFLALTYGARGVRPWFHNGRIDYRNYLWEDKDWVYFWDDQHVQGLSINRVKKEADFKFWIFLPIPFSPID